MNTQNPDEARVAQAELHRKAAVGFADRFRAYNATNKDWSYVPPTSDDPEDWTGVTKWCALEVSYTFHCRREGDLERGLKPTYCPEHGTKAEGFRPAPCFRCAWDALLYDQALANAREMGRKWTAQRGAIAELAAYRTPMGVAS